MCLRPTPTIKRILETYFSMMSRHNKKKYVNLISNILRQYVAETKKPKFMKKFVGTLVIRHKFYVFMVIYNLVCPTFC